MRKFLRQLIENKNGNPSLGRLGYLLTVVTSIFWVNVVFFIYVLHAWSGQPTPDMPAQIVMVIITLLGGYLGTKGMENMGQYNYNKDPNNLPAQNNTEQFSGKDSD